MSAPYDSSNEPVEDWDEDFDHGPPGAVASSAAPQRGFIPHHSIASKADRSHSQDNGEDGEEEDQRDTIKLSQLGTSTLAQLREASKAARDSAALREQGQMDASNVFGIDTNPDGSSQGQPASLSWDEEDGLELPNDLTAKLSSTHLSKYKSNDAFGVGSTSGHSSNFEDDFDFDTDDDPFLRGQGSAASLSGRSSLFLGSVSGGMGGGVSSTDGWTEPESPTPSNTSGSKHSHPSQSPSTTHSSPGLPSKIRPFTRASTNPSSSGAPMPSLHRVVSRSFPADQSAGAREAGMLGVDQVGSDFEADFDIDASVGRLMLSPALLHKPSDAALSSRELKGKASTASILSSGSGGESSRRHQRHSSQVSFSGVSTAASATRGSSSAEEAREELLDEDRDEDGDDEQDDDEHSRQERMLDGLVLPPDQSFSSSGSRSGAGKLSAASLQAMLKARKKGLLMPGAASALQSTPRKGPSEDMLSGLVITDDGDLSPLRLNSRKNRRAQSREAAPKAGKGKKAIEGAKAGPSTLSQPASRKPSSTNMAATSRPVRRTEAQPAKDQPSAPRERPRFAPASQIFARALASTDAFKDRMPQVVAGPSGSRRPRPQTQRNKGEQPIDAITPPPNATAASAGGTRPRRGSVAVRYTVSTASIGKKSSGAGGGRPPLPSFTPTVPSAADTVQGQVAGTSSDVPAPSVTTAEITSDDLVSGQTVETSSASLSPPQILRKPKRSRDYGDGTELDSIEDLPVAAPHRPTIEHRPIRAPGRLAARGLAQALGAPLALPRRPSQQVLPKQESISTNSATDKASTGPSRDETSTPTEGRRGKKKSKRRKPKKPMLIKNLGGPPSTGKSIGDMRWNPTSQTWEGNEADLTSFDEVLGSSSRPALITNYSSSFSTTTVTNLGASALTKAQPYPSEASSTENLGTPRTVSGRGPMGSGTSKPTIVGEMRFDPVKMCWIKASGEEEEDPFENMDDSDTDGNADRVAGATSGESHHPGDAPSSEGFQGDFAEEDAIAPPPEGFVEACLEAERIHKAEMEIVFGKQEPSISARQSGEYDREHLWLLPQLLGMYDGAQR